MSWFSVFWDDAVDGLCSILGYVHGHGDTELAKIAFAPRRLCRVLGSNQRGQQQARQNCDGGDDDEELDESEDSADGAFVRHQQTLQAG